MIKSKPLVGILPSPYIKDPVTKKQFISNEVFITADLITFLKQNSIEYIIIPYTITKSELHKILPNLDGFLFPSSTRGNYYSNKFIKQHFLKQKYIVNNIKLLAKNNILIPILALCHGYQNMILIENKFNLTNKNIKKTFINVSSINKTIPKFMNTKLGKLFKSKFNKTKKLYHSHKLAPYSKYVIKNYEVIATSLDKNKKEFIDIVKHKKYPFFGFQGHPEVENTKLFAPFISCVNTSFNKKPKPKLINKEIYDKLNLVKLNSRKAKKNLCNKFKLASTRHKKWRIFYKA
uniref:Glutamine amidotransferase domain-containing protein n=1 Tax=viral metagenome TaxID=1070528 RepID=A0A6C0H4R6_9ZZZZ